MKRRRKSVDDGEGSPRRVLRTNDERSPERPVNRSQNIQQYGIPQVLPPILATPENSGRRRITTSGIYIPPMEGTLQAEQLLPPGRVMGRLEENLPPVPPPQQLPPPPPAVEQAMSFKRPPSTQSIEDFSDPGPRREGLKDPRPFCIFNTDNPEKPLFPNLCGNLMDYGCATPGHCNDCDTRQQFSLCKIQYRAQKKLPEPNLPPDTDLYSTWYPWLDEIYDPNRRPVPNWENPAIMEYIERIVRQSNMTGRIFFFRRPQIIDALRGPVAYFNMDNARTPLRIIENRARLQRRAEQATGPAYNTRRQVASRQPSPIRQQQFPLHEIRQPIPPQQQFAPQRFSQQQLPQALLPQQVMMEAQEESGVFRHYNYGLGPEALSYHQSREEQEAGPAYNTRRQVASRQPSPIRQLQFPLQEIWQPIPPQHQSAQQQFSQQQLPQPLLAQQVMMEAQAQEEFGVFGHYNYGLGPEALPYHQSREEQEAGPAYNTRRQVASRQPSPIRQQQFREQQYQPHQQFRQQESFDNNQRLIEQQRNPNVEYQQPSTSRQ